MRRLLSTLVCLAALSTGAFAQDDHNDAGPLLVGYAVVTQTSGMDPFGLNRGIVVFETFGWRIENPALQASVLPATMTTRMVLFASSNIRAGRNVGVGITNPGSTNAVVTMTLRNSNGILMSTNTVNIAARQQTARFISDLFAGVPDVPPAFDGTLTLTSNTPVAIMALRFTGNKFTTIPVNSLSSSVILPELAPGIGGRDGVLLPQFVANNKWASEIVVLNNGALPLTVRIDLFNSDGTPMVTTLNHQSGSSFRDLPIPAGALIMFSPRNANGDSDF
jgi:hypothetical protein